MTVKKLDPNLTALVLLTQLIDRIPLFALLDAHKIRSFFFGPFFSPLNRGCCFNGIWGGIVGGQPVYGVKGYRAGGHPFLSERVGGNTFFSQGKIICVQL
jgi:hypothetical protein